MGGTRFCPLLDLETPLPHTLACLNTGAGDGRAEARGVAEPASRRVPEQRDGWPLPCSSDGGRGLRIWQAEASQEAAV